MKPMQTINSNWQVDSTHQMGYQAPTYFVETSYVVVSSKSKQENRENERKQALALAKKMTRLSDFPDKWEITVTKLTDNME
jgi:hypothetical protein